MYFVSPEMMYQNQTLEYIKEFEKAGMSINGNSWDDSTLIEENYEMWLEEAERHADTSVKIEGGVHDATFFYIEEEGGDIIGMANIRYGLNAGLFHEGGHIGFSVRPTCQGEGIATELLRDALIICRFIGLYKVLITCEKDNVASARVIQKCGGVLENEVVSEKNGRKIQRYWIENEGDTLTE